jgi:gamma-butyrobetaine hydroxylase
MLDLRAAEPDGHQEFSRMAPNQAIGQLSSQGMNSTLTSAPSDVAIDGRAITLAWSDGKRGEFPFAWLRDNCACALCRHPGSGQRLLEPSAIPLDIRPRELRFEHDCLQVAWAPDGHASAYGGAWLRRCARTHAPDAPRLWDATIAGELPLAEHQAVVDDPQQLRRWLEGVDGLGFGELSGVPVENGEVARVAELFGHVRVTNYGRVFDVRSVVEPANLAYTPLGLGPHTDNPYRDPVPSLQLLHCLSSSASGGESTLVDGFCVAEVLRAKHPADFAVLAGHNVTFAYRDEGAELSASAPIIELDPHGDVRAVRFNARSLQSPAMPALELAAWYDAYLRFARMLEDARFQVRLRLEPGDLFIVDNRRVLHGREPYAATAGERHLQGCYADIDGLRSTLAVLARDEADD